MIAPHSRTFAKTLDSEEARTFDGTAHFAGDGYGEYRYEFNKEGLAVKLEERFTDRFFPFNFAVGSGKHADIARSTAVACSSSPEPSRPVASQLRSGCTNVAMSCLATQCAGRWDSQ